MAAALVTSTIFLASYLVYHAQAGSTPYPHHDWTRPLYFVVLIPHIILAALMVPFILAAVILAWKRRFRAHTRITRWLWPVWMYVSVSGVAIYAMLHLR
jgi:putative membrane protein